MSRAANNSEPRPSGGRPLLHLGEQLGQDLHHLVHFLLGRLDPQPAPAESRQYHPENYWFVPDRTAAGRLEEAYRRLVLRDHARFVARALAESGVRGPLLDVGCGGGLLLGMLRARGVRVVGLDISAAAAAIASSRQRVPAVCGVLEHAPLRPGGFAAITMFHVLEHVHDPRAYVAAAHHLLAPGGRLIAQTPNAACWQFRLLGRAWSGLDVPRHLFDFRLERFRAPARIRRFHGSPPQILFLA